MLIFVILDDGSERTLLLSAATKHLGRNGAAEDLVLWTILQETDTLAGATVHLQQDIHHPGCIHLQQDGPCRTKLPSRYNAEMPPSPQRPPFACLLQSLTSSSLDLITPHLITPIEHVHLGPPGAPAALKTRLGWTLQGHTQLLDQSTLQQCLLTTSLAPKSNLLYNIEKLWQVDVLPFQDKKITTWSKQVTEAMSLDSINGIDHYSTHLLHTNMAPQIHAPKVAVIPILRRREKQLERKPELATIYYQKVMKLVNAGYIAISTQIK